MPTLDLVVTPQVFYELFLLCLSWQFDPEKINGTASTVDKVARVLNGLGIITDKQRKVLYKDRRTQFLFLQKSGQAYVGTPIRTKFQGVGVNHPMQTKDVIINFPTPLVISISDVGEVDRLRLLQNCRIYMTFKGKAIAESLEDRYASVITREKYCDECDRQKKMFGESDQSTIFVLSLYKKKVIKKVQQAQNKEGI